MTDSFDDIRDAIAAGDDESARSQLRTIIKESPSAEAYFLASKVAYTSDQSRFFLERALELDPFHIGAADALKAAASAPSFAAAQPDRRKPKLIEAPHTRMRLADSGVRLVAYIIDTIILSIIGLIFGVMIGLVFASPSISSSLVDNVSLVGGLAVNAAYNVYFLTANNGQTPGKSAVRIRVVKKDGSQLSASDAFLRNVIGYFFSAFILLIGFVWILIDQERQGFHDKLAGTLVIRAD